MKVAIVTEFIAPVQAIASVRWTKLAKYLSRDCDCDITVLTNQKSFEDHIVGFRPYAFDPSSIDDLSFFKTVYIPGSLGQSVTNFAYNFARHVLYLIRKPRSKKNDGHNLEPSVASLKKGSAKKRHSRLISRLPGKLLSSNLPSLIYLPLGSLWGKALYKAGLNSPLDWKSYDLLISTCGPVWTHRLAQAIKKDNPHLLWIADFRDPLVTSSESNTKKNRRLASELTQGADLVTAVSKGTLDNLFLPSDKESFVLTNGFDPEDRVNVFHDKGHDSHNNCTGHFRFVYTGSLTSNKDQTRDLRPLFRALEKLIMSNEVSPQDICVEYAGPTSFLFAPIANEFPLVPAIDHGLLSRSEAFALQEEASALVVATWNTEIQKGVLTGKIFEYMNRDAAIIGLCSGGVPDSDIKKLIEDCDLGICYEEADPDAFDALVKYIKRIYDEWAQYGKYHRTEKARREVTKYSYPVLARTLYDKVSTMMK